MYLVSQNLPSILGSNLGCALKGILEVICYSHNADDADESMDFSKFPNSSL